MKRLILFSALCTSLFSLNAQSNLLIDGGFESFQPGACKFSTISQGKVTGMSGKWQMIFAKGGCPEGCGKGSAAIVTTEKKSGNQCLEVKIDTQVNRNDIKVYQSISGTQVGGEYEVSVWIKASTVSPIAIDVLKSTQQNTNNGAPPFTGNFTANTEWQQFKLTVNVSDWTDEERTEMRVTVRLNNNKALPIGPYPKTFWVDDISIVKK